MSDPETLKPQKHPCGHSPAEWGPRVAAGALGNSPAESLRPLGTCDRSHPVKTWKSKKLFCMLVCNHLGDTHPPYGASHSEIPQNWIQVANASPLSSGHYLGPLRTRVCIDLWINLKATSLRVFSDN